MDGISWNLDAVGGSGPGWQWILASIGILMSIVMQSSSAAAATTLVALHAGSLTFEQACAMIVGQSIGTAATSALVAIGAGMAVRQAALAHIFYNVTVGILGILLLGPIAAGADWVGSRLDDAEGVLALAAFSSIFKLMGVIAFYPWLDRFSRLIIGISGKGSESAVSRLDPVIAEAGGAVALEAGWRATLELAHESVDAVRRRLAGEPIRYDPPVEATRQIDDFLESLSLETTDLSTMEPRLVRLCHALDHLNQLHDDLARIPSDVGGWRPPAGFATAALTLAAWLDTTKDPEAAPGAAILGAMKDVSKRITDERKIIRSKILEDVALQRIPAETARGALEMLAWADSAVYHAWRLAESLRIAAGDQSTAAAIHDS